MAFANGVNAYIAHAGGEGRLPVEFRLTGLRPGPWTPEIALLRTTTALPVANATSELRLARDIARVGVDSANKAARPSPHRDLVVPNGVDYSIIGDEVIAALTGLRGGVVRPPLLPEYRAMSDASDNRFTPCRSVRLMKPREHSLAVGHDAPRAAAQRIERERQSSPVAIGCQQCRVCGHRRVTFRQSRVSARLSDPC